MADRLDYFFRQRVTEAELDEGFEKLEQADRDLASDVGINGIISGYLLTENAVPNLTLDVSGPGVAYTQQGERVQKAATDNVDVSQDENGSSTAVGGGNERWVTVVARFDRLLSDLRVDGNGANVFFQRQESYELAVIMGAEVAAPAGPGDKPPATAADIIIGEFVMSNGKTTVLNADLDFDRRQDFVFASAGAVGVNDVGFGILVGTDVQTVLDNLDNKLGAPAISVTGKVVPIFSGKNPDISADDWVINLIIAVDSRNAWAISTSNASQRNWVVPLDAQVIPNGAVLQEVRATWIQIGGSAAMSAALFAVDQRTSPFAASTVIAATVISGVTNWVDEQVLATSLSETIDHLTNEYFFVILGPGGSNDGHVAQIAIDYDNPDVIAGAQ